VPIAFTEYADAAAEPESGTSYFVHSDPVGMPLHIEDASGRIVWWATRIDPYGLVGVHPTSELEYNLRWPGHYLDPETGLHYNRYRYYDPALGRYLQSDPLGYGGSEINLYAYPANPLVHVDVLGLNDGCGGTKGTTSRTDGSADQDGRETTHSNEQDARWSRTATDAELTQHLDALAQDAWKKMQDAYDAGEKKATLSDGTVLRVGDGDRQRGPCLSLVMDTVTGEVFYGQNTGREPQGLHEPLASRTDAVTAANQATSPAKPPMPPGWSRSAGIPGSHSEIVASDKALAARPDARMEDLAIYNVRTEDIGQETAPPMRRCKNCAPITDGARALTD
jgi:RHS repeat-associated protein